jgi:hypothetical protein
MAAPRWAGTGRTVIDREPLVEACSLGKLAIGIHATAAPAVAGKGPAVVAKLTNPQNDSAP